MKKLYVVTVLIILIAVSCENSQYAYHEANRFFQNGLYEQAYIKCNEMIKEYPNDEYVDSAKKLRSQCQFILHVIDANALYVAGSVDSAQFILNKATILLADSGLSVPSEANVGYLQLLEKTNNTLTNLTLLRSGLQDPGKYLSVFYEIENENPKSLNDRDQKVAEMHIATIRKRADLTSKKGLYANSFKDLIFLFSLDKELLSESDLKMADDLKEKIKEINEKRQLSLILNEGIKDYDDKMFCLNKLGRNKTKKLLIKSYPSYSMSIINAVVDCDAVVGMTFAQVRLSLGDPSDIFDLAKKNYKDWDTWFKDTGGEPTSTRVYVNMKFPSIGGIILGFMDGKLAHSLSQEISATKSLESAMRKYYSSVMHSNEDDAYIYGWTPEIEQEYGISPQEFNSMVETIIANSKGSN